MGYIDKKLTFGIILLLLISAIAVFGPQLSVIIKQNRTDNTDNAALQATLPAGATTLSTTRVLTPSPTPAPLEQSAWIPSWGSASGLASLQNNQDNLPGFAAISPVWYEVNNDGSLKDTFPSNRTALTSYLRGNNIALVPTISLFDHELLSKVLNNEAAFNKHVAQIVDSVVTNNYDGIDLDYESTELDDKDLYFKMLEQLSRELHERNKQLVVTVVAKWGDDILYSALPETRKVQDWSEIAKYADEIRIMSYDYTSVKAELPGPVAPLNWVDQVLQYAITKADASKFSLGIPLYSYRWSANATDPDFTYVLNYHDNVIGDSSNDSYTYNTVKGILKNKGNLTYYNGETLFSYTKSGKKYALTFFTPENIKEHVNLAQKYGLKGVCYWRLGDEADILKQVSDL